MTKLLCIVGPTASGKSDLAVEAALRWDAEVISLDASQVYRGFDIGTGKITEAEQRGVPHHLLSCVEPDERFNAGVFMQRADEVITELKARDKRVILCGGTGLYLQLLLKGICAAPQVKPEIEERLEERLRDQGVEALHEELSAVDPKLGAKLELRDKQRITRALGVYLSVGRTLGELQEEHRFAEQRYPALILGLDPPRELLNERIARRVDMMWASGFLDEVRALRDAGYTGLLRSMGAIGYRLALATLEGELTEPEAREKMLYATRQYARRQRRFFNSQLDTQWVKPPEGEARITLEQIAPQIEAWWG